MAKVFLSYRRSDTGAEAGRLADALRRQLGAEVVFRDVQSIPPGATFSEALAEELQSAGVVLVLIGPAWLEELKRRQKGEDTDYVLVEVAEALKGHKRVIPVLLRGASLANGADLPICLRTLPSRQTINFRDESWD